MFALLSYFFFQLLFYAAFAETLSAKIEEFISIRGGKGSLIMLASARPGKITLTSLETMLLVSRFT